MKTFRAILCWLLIASQCWAGVTYHGTTGQTLYVRVQTGAATFEGVALTEGSSGGLGVYTVTDAALVTGGVSTSSATAGYKNGFPFTVRSGTASDTANDTILATGQLPWSGTVELAEAANVTHFIGVAPSEPGAGDLADGISLFFADAGFNNNTTANANQLTTIDDLLDTEAAAIKLTTDHLATALELDGVVYRFTTNALEQGAAGGGSDSSLIKATTVASTPTTKTFTLTAGSPDDDAYTDRAFAVITDSVTSDQKAIVPIIDYVGSTRLVTILAAPPFATAIGDTVDIIADPSVTAESVETYAGSDLAVAIEGIDARIPAALVSGKMDSSLSGTQTYTHTGNITGNLSGSVGSVTVVSDKTGYSLTTAPPTAVALADAVWDELQAGHTIVGSFGKYVDSAISGVSTGGVSTADIADAVWDELRSEHVTGGTFGQGIASVQGNVTGSVGSVTGAVGSVTGAVGSVTGSVGSVTGAVGSVTSGVTVTTNNDKSGYALGAATIDLIWDEPKAGHTAANTFGSYLDAMVSSIPTGGLTVEDIAVAVWDEPKASHTIGGTYGLFLDAAISASGGGGGTADWTADERTAMRTILGIPASGTAPAVPSAGALKLIDDALPPALVGGRMDASVGAMAANTFTASAVAHDAAVEIGAEALGEGAGVIPTDVDQEPVPMQRTWVLVQTEASGLEGNADKSLRRGPSLTFAIDFRNDAAVNQRIFTVDSIAIESGTAGGITFGTPGRDRTQAKFRITAVTAGTYTIRCGVTYNDGASSEGVVTLVVP